MYISTNHRLVQPQDGPKTFCLSLRRGSIPVSIVASERFRARPSIQDDRTIYDSPPIHHEGIALYHQLPSNFLINTYHTHGRQCSELSSFDCTFMGTPARLPTDRNDITSAPMIDWISLTSVLVVSGSQSILISSHQPRPYQVENQ